MGVTRITSRSFNITLVLLSLVYSLLSEGLTFHLVLKAILGLQNMLMYVIIVQIIFLVFWDHYHHLESF